MSSVDFPAIASDRASISHQVLAGLNSRQTEAASSPFDRHCLILAGAGCGKTSVLTRRIALCASIFCDQQRILALTFTRKAAEEMRERLLALNGICSDAALPKVTTFHGFGAGVFRDTVGGIRNAQRLGYECEPRLIGEQERLLALASVSASEQRQALGVDLFGLDDLIACHAVDGRAIGKLADDKKAIVDAVEEKFRQLKVEKNVWEFSDMIRATLKLFSQHPDVADYYATWYKHIVVDEFQDTNPLQITLLKHLLKAATRIFAVGDDDQAIYGFRGADTGPILNFAAQFDDACVHKLETNYRSRPSILAAANRIFVDKPAAYRKVLRSALYDTSPAQKGRKPKRRICGNQHEMIAWIVKTMHAEKMQAHDVCLLFRLNQTLDWASGEMKKILAGSGEAPRMLTVHGAKGLEFPIVFLCDLEESVFPHYRRRRSERIRTWGDVLKKLFRKSRPAASKSDIEEERRLFYVAVTRAKEQLFLLSARKKYALGRTLSLEPSRFLRLV
jgi:superfamily I DNA/RNA helicase